MMTTGSFGAGWFETDPSSMPLSKLLPWTGRSLSRYQQRCAAAHGLTSTSLGVLGVLEHSDAVSHRELAARLGVTPATLTSVVDALEATGDLARARGAADRRVVHLSITVQGRERVAVAFAQVATAFRERLPHPPPEHHAIIRSYLLAVLAAVAHDAPG